MLEVGIHVNIMKETQRGITQKLPSANWDFTVIVHHLSWPIQIDQRRLICLYFLQAEFSSGWDQLCCHEKKLQMILENALQQKQSSSFSSLRLHSSKMSHQISSLISHQAKHKIVSTFLAFSFFKALCNTTSTYFRKLTLAAKNSHGLKRPRHSYFYMSGRISDSLLNACCGEKSTSDPGLILFLLELLQGIIIVHKCHLLNFYSCAEAGTAKEIAYTGDNSIFPFATIQTTGYFRQGLRNRLLESEPSVAVRRENKEPLIGFTSTSTSSVPTTSSGVGRGYSVNLKSTVCLQLPVSRRLFSPSPQVNSSPS